MIDINKKYQTKSGRNVRIYATDGSQGMYCVHAAYQDDDGEWRVDKWDATGRFDIANPSTLDLIEVEGATYAPIGKPDKNETPTKRELFAAMAMQGRLAGNENDYNYDNHAYSALLSVRDADALIDALNK